MAKKHIEVLEKILDDTLRNAQGLVEDAAFRLSDIVFSPEEEEEYRKHTTAIASEIQLIETACKSAKEGKLQSLIAPVKEQIGMYFDLIAKLQEQKEDPGSEPLMEIYKSYLKKQLAIDVTLSGIARFANLPNSKRALRKHFHRDRQYKELFTSEVSLNTILTMFMCSNEVQVTTALTAETARFKKYVEELLTTTVETSTDDLGE